MSMRPRLFALLTLLAVIPAAHAQYYGSYGAPEGRPVQFYVLGGFSQPVGTTNTILQGGYAVGFGVLFNFISVFTYVSFHLAAPPYLFTPTLLGALFITYLASSPLVPWASWRNTNRAKAGRSSSVSRNGVTSAVSEPPMLCVELDRRQ